MMMKGFIVQQQQPQPVEENMSNLTSASGEASVSSGNRAVNSSSMYQPQFMDPSNQPPPVKKRRNQPGNPDPDAEVIALSPKTLLATNRFVCDVCNKGFQRDQNLQLHRRGHNLPWKLKQRTNKEVRKKVYVCPEPSCVHHDPSRALGDLTGIKKHFYRKHGEKKWKCDKCSKRYAVRSDWKAHSKTCGTREYRCDCGTLFSRRDSFITHRAFCDALAEESARTTSGNPLLISQAAGTSTSQLIFQSQTQFSSHDFQAFSMKKEQPIFGLRPPEVPPWLACPPIVGPGPGPPPSPLSIDHLSSAPNPILTTRLDQDFTHENSIPNLSRLGPALPANQPAGSPHMSATALLQKATQMGAAMSISSTTTKTGSCLSPATVRHHEAAHVSADSAGKLTPTGFALNFSSREEIANTSVVNGLSSFWNKAVFPSAAATATVSGVADGGGGGAAAVGIGCAPAPASGAPPSFFQDMMMTGLNGSTYGDAFGSVLLDSEKDGNFHDNLAKTMTHKHSSSKFNEGAAAAAAAAAAARGHGPGGGNDGMTRDFLGLRPFSHSEILSIAGLGNCMTTSPDEQQ